MAGIFNLQGNNRWQSSAPQVESAALRSYDGRFVANGVGFEWVGMTMLDANIREIGEHAQDIRRQVVNQLAPVMEAYMKMNASWKDRTGEARAGLKAVVTHHDASKSSDINLSHSVFYGVFLEQKTYNGVSYAILLPTLEYFAPVFEGTIKTSFAGGRLR